MALHEHGAPGAHIPARPVILPALSAEEARDYVGFVMAGWDDLCPDGGSVYIVPKENSPLDWEIICGLHCSDSKLRTRLNSYNVREQLKEALLRTQSEENPYPETLPFTLHGKAYEAHLVDAPTNFKRGTRLTEDVEGDLQESVNIALRAAGLLGPGAARGTGSRSRR